MSLLWIGESDRPVKEDRTSDMVMDSVYNYYGADDPELPYDPGQLFIDNGAYTAKRQGVELDPDNVLDLQLGLDPEKAIPLDYPLTPKMNEPRMEEAWDDTKENIIYWQESSTLDEVIPTLHAWDRRSLENNLQWLQKYADTEMIALGSIVNDQFDKSGFFGDRTLNTDLIDMLSTAIKTVRKTTDFSVHLMGFGSSPITLHLGYYLGIESIDSAGYRRKAAYGKILLPGRGERHIGYSHTTFGTGPDRPSSLSSEEWKLLNQCSCEVCSGGNVEQLWFDWRARAIHNEHVMKEETRTAEELLSLGVDAYENYLNNTFGDSQLNYLLRHSKKAKRYRDMSDILAQ